MIDSAVAAWIIDTIHCSPVPLTRSGLRDLVHRVDGFDEALDHLIARGDVRQVQRSSVTFLELVPADRAVRYRLTEIDGVAVIACDGCLGYWVVVDEPAPLTVARLAAHPCEVAT